MISSVNSMRAHQGWLNSTANNVANVNTNGYRPTETTLQESKGGGVQAVFTKAADTGSKTSQTNLNKEVPNMRGGQRGFEANASAIKTQNAMMGTLLNIKA